MLQAPRVGERQCSNDALLAQLALEHMLIHLYPSALCSTP